MLLLVRRLVARSRVIIAGPRNGATVTSTNTSYNDENWNYLGNEWVEGSNGGWNFDKKITSGDIVEPS